MIVNGRKLGDTIGNKTCYKYNGSSTVDYFITTYTLLSKILNIQINNQTWYSDHIPITLIIKTNQNLENINSKINLEPIKQYKNESPHSENFKKLLNSQNIENQYKKICENDTNCPNKLLTEFKILFIMLLIKHCL